MIKTRKINFKILLLLLSVFLVSCEDVVEVNLDEEPPRLIVDALIRVDIDEDLTEANIEISVSDSFFGEIQPAMVDELIIQGFPNGQVVPYEPVPGSPGFYRPFATTISPVVDNKIVTSALTNPDTELILFVTYEDQQYFARTSFAPTVPFDNVEQGDGELFDEDDTEVILTLTDVAEREDYYVFDFDFNEFITSEDRFFEGQQFTFSYFYDTDLEPGDEVEISILGANEDFFNYMNGLLEQSQQGQNGPFQTPTATVRGNFLNVTDIDNVDLFDNVNRPDSFILGYFSISQEYKTSLVIE